MSSVISQNKKNKIPHTILQHKIRTVQQQMQVYRYLKSKAS